MNNTSLRHLLTTVLSIGIFAYALSSCRHEPYDLTKGEFPAEISGIMIRKCATEGCHDAAGAVNAAGLRLDTWDELFKGSSRGSVVVPYSTKYSILLYYINQKAHGNNDLIATPSMPYNQAALSIDEYNTIKNWIANGAPDANGTVAFASDADTRQKVYISQQGCEDLLTVVDAKSGLVMRYIPIGVTNITEMAHNVRVSSDGRYAYVCYYQGETVQKIDTRTDEVVATVNIGTGNWNVLNVSPDGSQVAVSGMSEGTFKVINTATMTETDSYNSAFTQPHGIAATANFDTFYITSQYSNVVYRLIPDDPFEPKKEIVIKGTEPIYGNFPGNPYPHEIWMSPDHSKFFLTCENTAEVRVVSTLTEEVIAVIPVGAVPKEMAFSKKRGLLFVTCMEDAMNKYTAKSKGSVYAIDINTMQVVGNPIYGDFYQPHGIAVDEKNDLIYIASSNLNPNGPAPHHAAFCNGRNGWYSIYDLNTLQPFSNIRYETTPDPYGSDIRFK